MNNRIYAMDTHFKAANAGPGVEEQVQLVKAAGYDGYYVTAEIGESAKVLQYREATQAAGLEFTAMLVRVELDTPVTDESLQSYADIIDALPRETILELSMTRGGYNPEGMSDTTHDEAALNWLKRIAPMAAAKGIQIVLYPHFHFWLETVSDALRLIKQLNAPNVGVIFCSYHWYRVDKERLDILDTALPYLKSVNLCGSRHWENEEDIVNGLNPSIEPLDAGTKDIAAIIARLKELNFTGPIGVQGYGVNASAQDALARSHAKLTDLLQIERTVT